MPVGLAQVGRADRIGEMRCKCLEVLPSIFTQHESLHMQVWNRSDELAMHTLDPLY